MRWENAWQGWVRGRVEGWEADAGVGLRLRDAGRGGEVWGLGAEMGRDEGTRRGLGEGRGGGCAVRGAAPRRVREGF